MYRALYYGASPDVFVNGDPGIGWKKASPGVPWHGGALKGIALRCNRQRCPPLPELRPPLQTAYQDSKQAMYT